MRGVNVTFAAGTVTAICGPVAAGKSTLLSVALGDAVLHAGTVSRCGTVAYCPQTPWIMNATVVDNITFGRALDAAKLRAVLHVCALEADMASLPSGIHTEIGARGVNLSGGQKARIALARAVYQDADIYLLDDVLSACDAHTSRTIFTRCIMGWLSGDRSVLRPTAPRVPSKTILLVTHHMALARLAHRILVLADGVVQDGPTTCGDTDAKPAAPPSPRTAAGACGASGVGSSDPVAASGAGAGPAAVEADSEAVIVEVNDSAASASGDGAQAPMMSAAVRGADASAGADTRTEGTHRVDAHAGAASHGDGTDGADARAAAVHGTDVRIAVENGRLTEAEERQEGSVRASVYVAYLKACGLVFGVGTLVLRLCVNGALVATDWSLSLWSTQAGGHSLSYYVQLYAALAGGSVLITLLYNLCWAKASTHAATVLHARMLARLLRAPVQFFDVTPTGRILNRFSRDTATVDARLSVQVSHVLRHATSIIAVVAVNAAVVPLVWAVVIPALGVYIMLQNYYRSTSREVQRLASVAKSPLFNHLSESAQGVDSIRAFGAVASFEAEHQARMRASWVTFWAGASTNRWLGMRLNWVGSCILCAATLLVVASADSISPGLAGLVLAYSLRITGHLTWLVRNFTATEAAMNSVERILHYTGIPQEAPSHVADVDEDLVRRHWPTAGAVSVNNLKARYRPELPLVLCDVSVAIPAGTKVGIVGRTGSGKSTLALCLSRCVEACGGRIDIDGVDIATIGLTTLRRQVGIIPQDPMLFDGTVRYNLDPTHKFTDEALVGALRATRLHDFVFQQLPHGLDAHLAEGGLNVSVGQRQLLCLARALLYHAKVIVLDEATASIDHTTEQQVQQVIDATFAHCTVLTIAHRLDTVMHSDLIIVMDAGRIVETGPPAQLLHNTNGPFAVLWRNHTQLAPH